MALIIFHLLLRAPLPRRLHKWVDDREFKLWLAHYRLRDWSPK